MLRCDGQDRAWRPSQRNIFLTPFSYIRAALQDLWLGYSLAVNL